MTLRNGLYSIHTAMTDGGHGHASGVIVVRDGKMAGGDSHFYYTGSYTFSEVGVFSSLTGRLGINNILDKDPPLVGQDTCPAVFCNGNTFPQVYDTLGRYVFLGLTADF